MWWNTKGCVCVFPRVCPVWARWCGWWEQQASDMHGCLEVEHARCVMRTAYCGELWSRAFEGYCRGLLSRATVEGFRTCGCVVHCVLCTGWRVQCVRGRATWRSGFGRRRSSRVRKDFSNEILFMSTPHMIDLTDPRRSAHRFRCMPHNLMAHVDYRQLPDA